MHNNIPVSIYQFAIYLGHQMISCQFSLLLLLQNCGHANLEIQLAPFDKFFVVFSPGSYICQKLPNPLHKRLYIIILVSSFKLTENYLHDFLHQQIIFSELSKAKANQRNEIIPAVHSKCLFKPKRKNIFAKY